MNLPTIIVASVIAIVFIIIVAGEIKKRKNGKGCCSCAGCAMAETCHNKKEE